MNKSKQLYFKNAIIFCFILVSHFSIACICKDYNDSISKNFLESDFVAEIKVTKTFASSNKEGFYLTNFEINKLFKGEEINQIYVYGNTSNPSLNDCSINLYENKTYLVYGQREQNAFLLTICSKIPEFD